MGIWRDRRTPQGHVTDMATGQSGPIAKHPDWGPKPPSGPGTWGHQPAATPVSRPTGPGTWGAPSHLPPVDHSREMNDIHNAELARGKRRDVAARTSKQAVHQSDWNTPGVKRALRRG